MNLDITIIILMMIAAIPLPSLLLGESIACRHPTSRFTQWWRKHIMDNINDDGQGII